MVEFSFALSSPITDEDWDAITDVDFDKTNMIQIITKHGKRVDFVKVVRCGECRHMQSDGRCTEFADDRIYPSASDFCSYGQRREEEHNAAD